MKNISEIINSGIPLELEAILFVEDLLNFSSDKRALEERLKKTYLDCEQAIEKLIGVNELYFICPVMTILLDEETLEKRLCYFSNLPNILNCHSPEEHEDRIKLLESIKSKKKLEAHFPDIYDAYEQYLAYCTIAEGYSTSERPFYFKEPMEKFLFQEEYVKNMLERNGDKGVTEKAIRRAISNSRYLNKMSFPEYIQDCVKKIRMAEEYRDTKLRDVFMQNSIDLNCEYLDCEKFNLYLAYRYFIEAQVAKTSNECQKNILFVSEYFRDDTSRKDNDLLVLPLKIDELHSNKLIDYEITPKQLYDWYKYFLKNHPEIKVVDLNNVDFNGMTPKEIEEFLFAYLEELKTNWEILPDNTSESQELFEKKIARGIRNASDGLSDKERQAKQKKLVDLFIEKQEFYSSTPYTYIIVGRNTFDGYVGYLYPNGLVVLDKYYENKNQNKVADGEAIYIMDIKDFVSLSKCPKAALMKDSRVVRRYHRGDWQGRVLNAINLVGNNNSDSMTEAVQKILKGSNSSNASHN